jgi:hypothetical protein
MVMHVMQGLYHQAILGDLNTMAHGIARLSPHYCCDRMRIWTIGRPEAHFWHHNLLSVPDPRFLPENDGQHCGTYIMRSCKCSMLPEQCDCQVIDIVTRSSTLSMVHCRRRGRRRVRQLKVAGLGTCCRCVPGCPESRYAAAHLRTV